MSVLATWKALIIFLTACTIWSCGANVKDQQQTKPTNDSSSCVLKYDSALGMSYYSKADIDPIYVGGLKEMSKVLLKNHKYPTQDCSKIMDSKIVVGCIISADGKLIGKMLIKGLPENKGCDANKNALETVSHLTDWIPGRCDGRNVTALFIVPIQYEWKE